VTHLIVVTTNYSFRERQGNSNYEKQNHSRVRVLFMELTDPHVVKNRTEVSAVTPVRAHLLYPIPMNSYASKSVKYGRKKSKFLFFYGVRNFTHLYRRHVAILWDSFLKIFNLFL